jgi:hypothetical protein
MVLSSRLLGGCPHSKCKPSNQLVNTTTAFKGEHQIFCILFCFNGLNLFCIAKFPETIKKPEFFMGFADNVGVALTFKILKNDLSTVLHISVVRSAADPIESNKRLTFKSDVPEAL